jgi:hypothetical protein
MGQTARRVRSAELDERIFSLDSAVDEGIRTELRSQLLSVRRAGNARAVMLAMYRMSLKLLGLIYKAAGHVMPGSDLQPCIMGALRGNPRVGKPGLGILPEEVGSILHFLRVGSNVSDHDAEGLPVTVERAEKMLDHYLEAMEWHYVLNPKGPLLPALYMGDRKLATSYMSEALRRLDSAWGTEKKDAELRSALARALMSRPETRRRRIAELKTEYTLDDPTIATLRREVRAELQGAVQSIIRDERGETWRTIYDRLFPEP